MNYARRIDVGSCTSAAERKRLLRRARVRRYRARVRDGAAVLSIAVPDYFALVGVLVDAGWLHLDESENKKEVERAVGAALAEMVSAFRRKNSGC
jgi:hypothetical protein